MRYLDIDLETDRTYDGFLLGRKGGILDNLGKCTKATKTKFGESANPMNPTPEQQEFMKTCLQGAGEQDKKVQQQKLEKATKNQQLLEEVRKGELAKAQEDKDVKKNKTKRIIIISAIGVVFVGLSIFLLKR